MNAGQVGEALEKVTAAPSPAQNGTGEVKAAAPAEEKPAEEVIETTPVEAAGEGETGGEDADFSNLFPGGEIFPPEEGEEADSGEQADAAKESLRQLLLTGDADLDDPAVAEKVVGAIIRSGPNGQRLLDSRRTFKALEEKLGYEPSGEELEAALGIQQQHQRILSDLESASPEDPQSMGPVLSWLLGDTDQPHQQAAEAFVAGVMPFLDQNYPELSNFLERSNALRLADRIERSAPSMQSEEDRKAMPEVVKWIRYLISDGSAAAPSGPAADTGNYWKQRFEDQVAQQSNAFSQNAFGHLHTVVTSTVKAAYGTLLAQGGYTDWASSSVIDKLAEEVSREIEADGNYVDALSRQIQRGVPVNRLEKQHAGRARTIIKRMAPQRMPELVKNFSASLLADNQRAHARARNGAQASGVGAQAAASPAEPRRIIEKRKPDESPEQWRRGALDRAADLTAQKISA